MSKRNCNCNRNHNRKVSAYKQRIRTLLFFRNTYRHGNAGLLATNTHLAQDLSDTKAALAESEDDVRHLHDFIKTVQQRIDDLLATIASASSHPSPSPSPSPSTARTGNDCNGD